MRRLERGTFAFPASDAAEVQVTAAGLAMIPGGIDPAAATRRPRHRRPGPAA